jgi:hypothetical protein
MRPRTIDLHIDELVLHGFPSGDRRRIGQALERELVRLLAESSASGALPVALSGGAVTGGASPSSPGGEVHLPASSPPDVAGAEVARAVYRSLSAGSAPRPPATAPRRGKP